MKRPSVPTTSIVGGDMQQVLIIGYGGIGAALAAHYRQQGAQVTIASRQSPPVNSQLQWQQVDESQLAQPLPWLAHMLQRAPTLVICTIGVLHDSTLQPEKSIRQLQAQHLERVLHCNVTLPLLWLQQFAVSIERGQQHKFLVLSAKVGSISDNQLGGWYSYRASKAALNMAVKTCAIELKRSGFRSLLVAVHPGTTDSPLSMPFQRGLPDGQLQTAAQTAVRLANVAAELIPAQHGALLNWDGQVLPY